jgi:hypothetical protein
MAPYITDAERQHRPDAYRQRYRFFVDFVYKNIRYRRWFETKSDRTRYADTLGSGGAILGYGEEFACEYCGEPAGEGGAICPACVKNHGVK